MRNWICAALCVAAGQAGAQTAPIDPQLFIGKGEVIAASYVCKDDVTIPAVFLNATNGESFLAAVIEGHLYGMRQVISASGARYKAPGDPAYVLWVKGDGAFVMIGDDGPIVIDGCVSQ